MKRGLDPIALGLPPLKAHLSDAGDDYLPEFLRLDFGEVNGDSILTELKGTSIPSRVPFGPRAYIPAPLVSTFHDSSLHGEILVERDHRDGLERLCRYNASLRPPRIACRATTAYSCAAPDVGADGLGLTVMGVYNRVYSGHRDIHSVFLGSNSAFNGRAVVESPLIDHGAPRISSTSGFSGSAFYFVVGWSAREITTGASSVQTARVEWNGVSALGPFTIPGPSTTSLSFDVEVSAELAEPGGLPPNYIVTYDDRPFNETEAFVATCTGGNVHGTYELQVLGARQSHAQPKRRSDGREL